MTPEQRIKRHILLDEMSKDAELKWDGEITEENVDEAYDSVLVESDSHWDAESEFRCSGEDTEIPCESSRHYESKSVARQLSDGTWVGWTYWFGGGKHSEPEAIDWMGDAYEVTAKEETRIVRVFTKAEAATQKERT